jgi:membrane protein YdbS with pleckstrin-like domain
MFCNQCGKNLADGSRFCNYCGNQLPDAVSGSGTVPRRQSRGIPPPISRPARRRMNFQEEYYEEEDFIEEDDSVELLDEEEDDDDNEGANHDEETIFSITPAFYEVGMKYFFAVIFSILTTALIAYYFKSYWTAAAVVFLFFVRPIYHHIQHNHTVYTLTTVKVEIESGVFSKNSRNIPLRHIQDVTVNQTLKERMLGIGNIEIDSATIEGTMPLRAIKDPRKYADLILNELQYWN